MKLTKAQRRERDKTREAARARKRRELLRRERMAANDTIKRLRTPALGERVDKVDRIRQAQKHANFGITYGMGGAAIGKALAGPVQMTQWLDDVDALTHFAGFTADAVQAQVDLLIARGALLDLLAERRDMLDTVERLRKHFRYKVQINGKEIEFDDIRFSRDPARRAHARGPPRDVNGRDHVQAERR